MIAYAASEEFDPKVCIGVDAFEALLNAEFAVDSGADTNLAGNVNDITMD